MQTFLVTGLDFLGRGRRDRFAHLFANRSLSNGFAEPISLETLVSEGWGLIEMLEI